MAGAGKKTFVQGNVLNASEVNTYLMDQSVMVFADATARDAALPAGTRSEGMTCYLKSDDTLYVYTNAWYAFAAGTGYMAAWTGYTPTLTNISLGNGTLAFTYVQVGKTVTVRGRLTFGTTTSVSGSLTFSLPVNATGVFTGTATMRAGGTDYIGFIGNSSTSITIGAVGAAGTYANRATTSATVPGTWTNADNISFTITYEAA